LKNAYGKNKINKTEGVEKIHLRSDTAGYQHDLLRYCEKGENERYGKIEFAISCDVTKKFKKVIAAIEEPEWKTLYKEIDGKRVPTGQSDGFTMQLNL
jgi:hypothetical protein